MVRKQKPDLRTLPCYTIREASHYLRVADSTLRYWACGQGGYEGVIEPADKSPTLLSFLNLVELHVIRSITREHNISFVKLRSAINFLKEKFDHNNPLLHNNFETDGVSLFIEHLGEIINISQDGQIAMREIIRGALRRVERDNHGIPIKIHPYTRSYIENAPSSIVIDPHLSGGRPVIAGSGVATAVVAERYKAGDSIKVLAKDYGRTQEEIEEAVRCELQAA